MTIIRFICLFILLFYLSFQQATAQGYQKQTEKVGGAYRPFDSPNDPTILDNAILSIIYRFEHKVTDNKDVRLNPDTMQLVSGPIFSIYFDRNNETRRKLFSDFHNKNDAPKGWASVSYPDFLEMATDDDNLFIPQKVGDTYELYKERDKNLITVMDFDDSSFMDNLYFFYEEHMRPIGWEIHEDTTSVLGYVCTKATCYFGGRSYTAWFTRDIPINDGPYKFYGLPGMIMKLEDSEGIFKFTAIGLEKTENTEIIIQDKSKYEEMTKNQYFEIKKRMQQNRTLFYRSGVLLHFSNKKDGIAYTPIEVLNN